MKPSASVSLGALFVLPLLALHAVPAQIDMVSVEKFKFGTQTDTSAPLLDTLRAEVHIQGSNLGSFVGQITLPNAGSPVPLSSLADTHSGDFPDSPSLDGAYPNGNYVIEAGPSGSLKSVTLALGTDSVSSAGLFPTAAPKITNGTWSNNQLLVNANADHTFTFNTTISDTFYSEFTSHLLTGAAVTFSIRDTQGNQIASSTISTFDDTVPPLSFNLVSGSLAAGQTYEGLLEYALVTDIKTASDDPSGLLATYGSSQALAVAIFGTQTYFTIAAVPEPSTYAALAGIMVLGLAALRRRRARAAV